MGNPTSAKRNNIVFANRNQQYGAYIIRQRYNKTMASAYVFTFSACVLLVLFLLIKNMFFEREKIVLKEEKGVVVELLPVNPINPEVLPPLPKPPVMAPAMANVFSIPQVIDDIVNIDPPVQDPNINANHGLTTNSSDTGTVESFPPIGTGSPENTPVEITDVQEIPMFPGGTTAMMSYLISKMRYPVDARNNNIHGTVYISFVVDKDGNIDDAKVMRGIGGGCDEEALRVVRAMPAWSPGKQNGRAVMVRLILPVLFSLR